jgi:hypothetical protein
MREYSVLSHREFALKLLNRIHSGAYVLYYLELIHENLRAGRLTPRDIFTTPEHLELLRVKILQRQLLTWLNQLRLSRVEYVSDTEYSRNMISELLQNNRISDEKLLAVGISREELKSYNIFL